MRMLPFEFMPLEKHIVTHADKIFGGGRKQSHEKGPKVLCRIRS